MYKNIKLKHGQKKQWIWMKW